MRAIFLLPLAVLAAPAFAHDAPGGWECEQFCCNGNSRKGDCQTIPATTVRIIDAAAR